MLKKQKQKPKFSGFTADTQALFKKETKQAKASSYLSYTCFMHYCSSSLDAACYFGEVCGRNIFGVETNSLNCFVGERHHCACLHAAAAFFNRRDSKYKRQKQFGFMHIQLLTNMQIKLTHYDEVLVQKVGMHQKSQNAFAVQKFLWQMHFAQKHHSRRKISQK